MVVDNCADQNYKLIRFMQVLLACHDKTPNFIHQVREAKKVSPSPPTDAHSSGGSTLD